MELLPYSDGDIALTEALECDPEMMRELGGPIDQVKFRDRPLRVNHWELDVSARSGERDPRPEARSGTVG